MAAAAALNVVKQINAFADGPPTAQMRECLGQVMASLQFVLDHPDSNVRLTSAQALLKLVRGYSADMQNIDFGRARAALERQQSMVASGSVEATTQDLLRLLLSIFEVLEGGNTEAATAGSISYDDRGGGDKSCSSSLEQPAATTQRGEVVLKVHSQCEGKWRAAVLDKVVALRGVLSVTFEAEYIIVSTRKPCMAAEGSFLVDLLTAVRAEGADGVTLVSTNAGAVGSGGASSGMDGVSSGAEPRELEPKIPQSPGAIVPNAGKLAASSLYGDLMESPPPRELEDDDEPMYLDDDEEEEEEGPHVSTSRSETAGQAGHWRDPCGSGPLSGAETLPSWSFFSQNYWMTGRRLQEFDEDPSITARLAKAKKRAEEKKKEESSAVSRVLSFFTR